ncbi:hypothetical protein K439DRAFT_1081190 [Ramaria rubella]|nr:hypothetical protein K439DRAFT_1081190 [Ramaria rubella]
MAPFSVSQLKDAASSAKSSGADKFQNVRAKFANRSPVDSSNNHRDSITKAPPLPPPQRTIGVGEDTHTTSQRSQPPPPVRCNTRSDAQVHRPIVNQGVEENIKWASLASNDKALFFGWLDEFFNVKQGAPFGKTTHQPENITKTDERRSFAMSNFSTTRPHRNFVTFSLKQHSGIAPGTYLKTLSLRHWNMTH